jgi:hypothetical protein
MSQLDDGFELGLRALRQEVGSVEQAHALEQRLLDRLGPEALAATATTSTTSLGRTWTLLSVCVLLGTGALFGDAPQEPRARLRAHVEPVSVPAPPVERSGRVAPVPPVPALQAAPAVIEVPAVKRRGVRRRVAPVEPLAVATGAAPSRSLEDELALLERSREALRDDFATALLLAEQHGREYPTGRFVQEREVLAIQALLKQGRDDEAVERTQRFIRDQSGSPYVLRLRHMLASKPRSAEPAALEHLESSVP